MVVADAVLRKLPGALGHAESALEESFSVALEGRPEYPHYTRPAEYRGWKVPDVLLSGHHAEIGTWRRGRPQGRRGRQPPLRAPPGRPPPPWPARPARGPGGAPPSPG